ncbi:hypothetical protein FGIG_04586 [Fasciola gigantica]|uniref:Uncharacterized protein n=1 Tax=Fasciola gigantica TaxID=46835 RepID=A0A504YX46_FASGI|nr:hypothetical protein FGIG_04586 [Fasciola gigantica]
MTRVECSASMDLSLTVNDDVVSHRQKCKKPLKFLDEALVRKQKLVSFAGHLIICKAINLGAITSCFGHIDGIDQIGSQSDGRPKVMCYIFSLFPWAFCFSDQLEQDQKRRFTG